ncbi:serine/threonine protein kinase [Pseudenhygromyxa sp. WMMC2535]|uniref:serine/threonine-protein kinase n=1 Tax=Pseudenhygromyxa sp. WMMC2535 TaxID=2712867 RepID=UPI001594FD5D|nr:serine/threonine-protein kinase [Pseudenhygromyxa sp. WMMC2535]NVB40656.1 serine/threonine protein kinase [Pseudenhygromyxa sp. WMMC2535]
MRLGALALEPEELSWTEPGSSEPEEGTLVGAEFEDDQEDLPSGSKLGRYVVLSKMGAGGMGEVYAAYDPELDRRVAVKLMHQQGDSEEEVERASRRLLAEAKAIAQLSHPNVITVHDVGTIGDRVFIAMEFVEGMPLSDWMRRDGLGWQDQLEVFTRAGRGLEAAHKAGLIHRDFKPDNVLVGDDGRVRVLDFGLARRFDSRESGDKRRDREAGTPAYMSPEQHLGKELDHRTDQFSFCVALYEALYGELPFSAKTRFELALAVTDGQVGSVPKGATVPSWVRWALLRGLDPDPNGRWADMGELLSALSRDPYRKWRGVVVWASAALILMAFAFALVQLVGGDEDEGADPVGCAGSQEALAEVWGPQQKQALEQAFAASGQAWADAAARGVSETLDDWGERWTEARREACEATLSQTQSEEMLDRRMICLDRQLDDVEDMVAVLSAGDVQAMVRARETLADLPKIEACSAAALTVATASTPTYDEAQRLAVDQIEDAITRARNLETTSHFEEALASSQRAITQAEAFGDEQLLARAQLGRADILLASERLDEAAALLEHAELAAERSGDDRLRAKIIVNLARVHVRNGAAARAGRRVMHARAVLQRIHADELAYAELAAVSGLAELAAGRPKQARSQLRDAIVSLEDNRPPPSQLAELRDALGVVELELGRYPEAEAALVLARDQWSEDYGPQHPMVARARVHLAEVALAQGELEQALTEYQAALPIYEQSFGADSREVGVCAAAMADTLRALGREDEALSAYERARVVFEAQGEPARLALAAVLDAEGSLRRAQGDADEALDLHERALGLWEAARGPKHADLAGALCHLGEDLLALERVEDARGALGRALEIVDAQGPEGSALAASIHHQLARAVAAGEEPDLERARSLAEQARRLYRALDQDAAVAELDAWLENMDNVGTMKETP